MGILKEPEAPHMHSDMNIHHPSLRMYKLVATEPVFLQCDIPRMGLSLPGAVTGCEG